VLIIEDDGAMRAVLRDVLHRAGHRVTERADGTDLPNVIERETVDCVILDKEIPGPNGLDLLPMLRKQWPTVPVILVTSFGGAAVAEEAAKRGAYSYLEKPFRIATILDTLAAVPIHHLGGTTDRSAVG
jgi:DNA-binding NtrC family response regulator